MSHDESRHKTEQDVAVARQIDDTSAQQNIGCGATQNKTAKYQKTNHGAKPKGLRK